MKYAAIWAIVTAALLLIAGGVGLLIQWILADPSKAWLGGVAGAAILIGTIAAAVEYLSDQSEARKRNPRAVIPPDRNA